MYFAIKQAHTTLAVLLSTRTFFFFLSFFYWFYRRYIFEYFYPKYSLIQYHNHGSYKKKEKREYIIFIAR